MHKKKHRYVHGYSARESKRLVDQATTLTELLHCDTRYPAGSSVLEAGCGIGAQTVTLAANSPQARFTSVDLSAESLEAARLNIESAGFRNVDFFQADIFNLPFPPNNFDHIFVCFVLEHLKNPEDALSHLKAKLKKGGSITVIEGDHGSAYFHPRSQEAQQTIQCLIDVQARMGGDSLIGRQLFPLMTGAGFRKVTVSPRMVYVDSSKPEYVEGFTRNTFIAMVEGSPRAGDKVWINNGGSLGEGNRCSSQDCRGGWHVLLYIFQRSGLQDLKVLTPRREDGRVGRVEAYLVNEITTEFQEIER